MSPVRLLPIINAIGCLALAGFILLQWFDGNATEAKLNQSLKDTIHEKNARMEAEHRAKMLESDVSGLKASIESIQAAATLAEKELVEKGAQLDANTKSLQDAETKVKEWEDAVKARDEALALRDTKLAEAGGKLKELNDKLVATRKRLDEAVAELKKAGAR